MNVEELAVTVARHDERITDLETWRGDHERKQNGSLEKIWTELDALRREFAGRPTWAVTMILTSLSSLVVALATFLLTRK